MFLRFCPLFILCFFLLQTGTAFALAPLTVDVGKVVFQTDDKITARVLVSVGKSDGAPVSDLKRDDFEIRENGGKVFYPARVSPLVETEHRLFYFLMMDIQADSPTSLTYMRRAAARFIMDLGYRYPGLVMTYAGPQFVTQWADSPKRMEEAVQAIRPADGEPRLVDGLFFAWRRLSDINRENQKNFEKPVLILFTDGRDHGSLFSLEAAKTLILESRISLFLVWYGPRRDTIDKLADLAEKSAGGVFYADSPEQLPEKVALIADRLKHLYLVTYESALNNPFNQAYDLEVRVRAEGRIGIGRQGYITPPKIVKPNPLTQKIGLIGGLMVLYGAIILFLWFRNKRKGRKGGLPA